MSEDVDPKELRGYAYACGMVTQYGSGLAQTCEKAEGHDGDHAAGPFVEWTLTWPQPQEPPQEGE